MGILGLAVAALGAVVVTSAVGQDAAPPVEELGIGVCDLNEVYANYDRAADLNAELDKRRQKIRQEAERRAQEQTELSKELGQWKRGSEMYEKRFLKLEEMRAQNDAWQKLTRARVERWHLQMTRQMYDEIVDAVGAVAQRRGLSAILHVERGGLQGGDIQQVLQQMSRRTVLYADEGVDLTDAVLKQVNATYQRESR